SLNATPFDFVLEVFENSRNAHRDRDPVVTDKACDLARMNVAGEDDRTFEKHRNEQALRLTEHMAQRQQIENTNGLKRPGPQPVLSDFLSKRPQVAADVAMSRQDTFGLGGGY